MKSPWKRFAKSTFYLFIFMICGAQAGGAQDANTSSPNDPIAIGKNIPNQQLNQIMLYGTVKVSPAPSQDLSIHVQKRKPYVNHNTYSDIDQFLKIDEQTKIYALENPSVILKLNEIKKGQRVIVLGKDNTDKTFQTAEIAVWTEKTTSFRGMGSVHPSVNTLLKGALDRIDLLDPNAYKKRKDQLTKIVAFAGEIGDIEGVIIATNFKVDANINLNEPHSALSELSVIIFISEDTGYLYKAIPALIKTIAIERGLEENDKVIRDGKKTLKTIERVKKTGNPEEDVEAIKKAWAYDVLDHMHNVYIAQKNYHEATRVAEQSLEIATSLDKPNFQAASNIQLANAVIGMNDFEQGRSHLYAAYHLLDPKSAGYNGALMRIYAVAYLPAPELAEICYERGTRAANESTIRMWERMRDQLQRATAQLMQQG